MSAQPETTYYTQVPDALIERHGLIVAAVYGRIRRYIRDGDTKCRRSMVEIGEALGVAEKTVRRAVVTLEAAGLIRVHHKNGHRCLITLTGALQFAQPADSGAMVVDTADSVTAVTESAVGAGSSHDRGLSDRGTADSVTGRKERQEERQEELSPVSESGTGVGVPETNAAPLAPHASGRGRQRSQAPAKPQAQPHAIQALVDALQAELGESQASYKRHVRDAKQLADDGATAEDVVGCIRWILAHPRRAAFYADQPLTMTTVRKLMRGYRTDPAPLEHVRRCYRAILRGVRIDEADATPEVLGDYWDLARTAVATDATPDQIDAATARALTADRRNADLPPTARMVGAQLTAIRAATRRAARAKEAAHA